MHVTSVKRLDLFTLPQLRNSLNIQLFNLHDVDYGWPEDKLSLVAVEGDL